MLAPRPTSRAGGTIWWHPVLPRADVRSISLFSVPLLAGYLLVDFRLES
jgi:hypothetical protein